MASAPHPSQDRALAAPEHLDLERSEEFRNAAESLLEVMPGSSERLVIDLSATVRLDSAGMRTLLLVRRRASALGVTVQLRGARQEIRTLMALAKVNDLFEFDSGSA